MICYLEYVAVGLNGAIKGFDNELLRKRVIESVAVFDRAESSYVHSDITSWPLPKPSSCIIIHEPHLLTKAGLDVI